MDEQKTTIPTEEANDQQACVAEPAIPSEQPVVEPVIVDEQSAAEPVTVDEQPTAESVTTPDSIVVVEQAPELANAQTITAFCSSCGTAIFNNAKFCPNCGKSVNAPAKKPAANLLTKKPVLIGIGVAALALIIALVVMLMPPKEIPATDLVLSTESIELKETENTTVSCNVYPLEATDKTVTWSSSNPSVATVNELGAITAVGKGECVITAQCGTLTKTIRLTVKANIDFKALYDEIDSDVKYGWKVGSDGSYLSADDNVYDLDDYSNANIWASIKEMNKKLGLPASLTEDMGGTSWSMGRQNKTFPSLGLEVTWTYHPDKGMEVTYKLLID